MADHDEEDLFADLYENDDAPSAAPAAAPPAPVAPAEPEHPAGSEQTDSAPVAAEPASVPDPIANGSNGAATYDQNQQDSYGNGYEQESHDQNMQGGQNYDYNNNNQGNDYGAPQNQQQHHQEEDYKPIGIKEDGKMFIGGLNWETTDQSLRDYFSQFGEVVECTVMRDGATGRSRGFGFLTFRDPKTVNIVMVKEHQLDGKIIDPKRAIPRDEQERTSKIFVGGVSQEATEQDFKNFFMQFGRVLDATLMMDKDTGRPRGFGFVTFDSEAAVDRTLERPLEILGKYIEVKKAQPRGNIRDDNEGGNGRFNKHNKFAGNNAGAVQGGGFSGGGSMGDQGGQGMGGANGMSPAMMAQYWQRMQQYFQVMQQQMAANMGGGGGMNPMMGGGQPNPAMMQQMMAMQNGGMGRGGPGGGQDPNQMNPAMMQQMQQMQQMQAMQNGGNNNNSGTPIPSGPAASASPMNGGPGARPGYTAQEQMAFEQQKYERQQSARMGSQTSWEGMYDEVPAPGGGGVVNQGGMGGGQAGHQAGGGYRGGRGGRGRGGMHHGAGAGNMTPQGPAQAPINAPTGPKNAGKPGANYRGGGRGGGHRGFHPYGRGGGQ